MIGMDDLLQRIRIEKLIWFSEWHGIDHWERVRRNGRIIAESNGGDSKVVDYFAYLHDCCRVNEENDPHHGPRAAAFAIENRKSIQLSDCQFHLLCEACRDHTFSIPEKGKMTDPTLAACWDGDRPDLPRVGILPDPDLLFSDLAKNLAEEFSHASNISLGAIL